MAMCQKDDRQKALLDKEMDDTGTRREECF